MLNLTWHQVTPITDILNLASNNLNPMKGKCSNFNTIKHNNTAVFRKLKVEKKCTTRAACQYHGSNDQTHAVIWAGLHHSEIKHCPIFFSQKLYFYCCWAAKCMSIARKLMFEVVVDQYSTRICLLSADSTCWVPVGLCYFWPAWHSLSAPTLRLLW